MNNKFFKWLFLGFIIILVSASIVYIFIFNYKREEYIPKTPDTDTAIKDEVVPKESIPDNSSENSPKIVPKSESEQQSESKQITTPIPDKKTLDVAFQVQAPNANWDQLHEEACEEASLMMVAHYTNKTSLGGDQEILDLVKWQEDNGYKQDVTLKELSEIANKYYKLNNARIETDLSVEKIKSEIASGRPVIVPAAGKILPNPYFSNGGPNYHMLVIKGYDKEKFITNDPGTKRGEGFTYSYDSLMNAVHDWDAQNILNGQKAYLVFD